MTELAGLGTTWKAIASTPGVYARNNTLTNPTASTGVPIYRLDYLRMAGSQDGQLCDGCDWFWMSPSRLRRIDRGSMDSRLCAA